MKILLIIILIPYGLYGACERLCFKTAYDQASKSYEVLELSKFEQLDSVSAYVVKHEHYTTANYRIEQSDDVWHVILEQDLIEVLKPFHEKTISKNDWSLIYTILEKNKFELK